MVNKIEYIGIVVKNLEEFNFLFEKLLGVLLYKFEEVESEGVLILFFQIGINKIEFLVVINLESLIVKFLEKKGEGIYYIVFDVEDIFVEIE